MALPLGPLITRLARGTHRFDKPQRNPPSPQTNASAEDQRENNLEWGENDIRRHVAELQGQIRRAGNFVSRAEELIDEFVARLNARGFRLPLPHSRASGEAHGQSKTPPFNDPIWKRLARRGIGQLLFSRLKNGDVKVSIDGAEHVMSTALADLLAVLVDDDRCDDEGFPPFRSYAELAEAYKAKRRNGAGKPAVRVGLNRLQRLLWSTALVSHRIIEVRGGAARLRIRRPADAQAVAACI
jgi:hypothetical protein